MRLLRKFLRRKYVAFLLIALGVVGIGVSTYLYMQTPKPPKVATGTKAVSVAPAPSSKKLSPKVIANYTVPGPNPKYIAIPSIGVTNTPIVRLGLLKTGAIATPDNIYEAGWYDASVKPGQTGAMFIYGHVSSWTANGIFYNLKKLVAGNKVIITRGDNKTYTYTVVSSKIYPYNNVNMQQVLAPTNPSKPALNLMTCTGQVIKGTSEFNERLVVFTNLTSVS